MRRLLPALAVIAAVSVSAAGQSSPIDDFKQDFAEAVERLSRTLEE